MQPEREQAELAAHQVQDKEQTVDDSKTRRERGSTYVDLILCAEEVPLQRISIRSLICLALLLWDEEEELLPPVLLSSIYHPKISVHQYAHQFEN